jgi:hypothetical protein
MLWFWLTDCAQAHQGPPIPIVMDQRVGPYIVSVWTDPDVGVGRFWVFLEAAPGAALPEENAVEVCVQPMSGRLQEACYPATRQEERNRVQYYTEVDFDQQEMWRVRVRVSGAAGGGEVTAQVEATPPGYGRWDLLIYAFPFMLFGLLWLAVALRRRRRSIAESDPASRLAVPNGSVHSPLPVSAEQRPEREPNPQ